MSESSLNEARRQLNRDMFANFDRRVLMGRDDRSLAEWQSRFDQDEAQWRIAEHEWQRRLTEENIKAIMKAARGQAWFGIAAGVIGSILTILGSLFLRWLLP